MLDAAVTCSTLKSAGRSVLRTCGDEDSGSCGTHNGQGEKEGHAQSTDGDVSGETHAFLEFMVEVGTGIGAVQGRRQEQGQPVCAMCPTNPQPRLR